MAFLNWSCQVYDQVWELIHPVQDSPRPWLRRNELSVEAKGLAAAFIVPGSSPVISSQTKARAVPMRSLQASGWEWDSQGL